MMLLSHNQNEIRYGNTHKNFNFVQKLKIALWNTTYTATEIRSAHITYQI